MGGLILPDDPERATWRPGRRLFLQLSGLAFAGTMVGGRLFGREESGTFNSWPSSAYGQSWTRLDLMRGHAARLSPGDLLFEPLSGEVMRVQQVGVERVHVQRGVGGTPAGSGIADRLIILGKDKAPAAWFEYPRDVLMARRLSR